MFALPGGDRRCERGVMQGVFRPVGDDVKADALRVLERCGALDLAEMIGV